MTTPTRQTMIPRSRSSLRPGFTLAELMVSVTIMTILMGAMTSVILVASHAMPDSDDPAQKRLAAMDVVDQIAGELFYAISITEETDKAVTFTVADRGHGAAGPETIRYAWSDTKGDPLTRQYNGGTVVNVSEAVEGFKLKYTTRTAPLLGAARVLFVVGDDTSPHAQELAKKALMESWGLSVQMVGADRTQAEFNTLIPDHDVMYISTHVNIADTRDKSFDLAMGILTEEPRTYDQLGIGERDEFSWAMKDEIWIIDNTHEITSPFPTGQLTICNSDQRLDYASGELAPGLQVLAEWPGPTQLELAVLDVGAEQWDDGKAKGRRVKLPWGEAEFDIDSLNSNGETIMRRSILWAAASVVYSSVRIELKPAQGSEKVRTEVQILNMPRVNTP